MAMMQLAPGLKRNVGGGGAKKMFKALEKAKKFKSGLAA